jgi:ParB family transcriptional regulator, chromosome partitioning protein
MRGHSKKETPVSLARRYEEQARTQRTLVKDLRSVQRMLDMFDQSFACLLADEHFTTLLRAENLDRIPAVLLARARK